MSERYERCVFCNGRYKESHDVLFTVCPRCTKQIREYRKFREMKRKQFKEVVG